MEFRNPDIITVKKFVSLKVPPFSAEEQPMLYNSSKHMSSIVNRDPNLLDTSVLTTTTANNEKLRNTLQTTTTILIVHITDV